MDWEKFRSFLEEAGKLGSAAAITLAVREYFANKRVKTQADAQVAVEKIKAEAQSEVQASVSEAETARQDATQVVPALLLHMRMLEEKNTHLVEQLATAQASIAELQRQMGRLEAEMESLRELNVALVDQNRVVVENNTLLMQQNQSLSKTNEELGKALAWFEENNALMKTAINNLQAANGQRILGQ